jgi:hypothetical protein
MPHPTFRQQPPITLEQSPITLQAPRSR